MNKTAAIKHAQLLARQHPIDENSEPDACQFVVYCCDDYNAYKIMRLDDYYNLNTVDERDVCAIVGYLTASPGYPAQLITERY